MIKIQASFSMLIALFLAVFITFSALPAGAQNTADTLQSLEPFLQKARESGATVIVVDPAKKPEVAADSQ